MLPPILAFPLGTSRLADRQAHFDFNVGERASTPASFEATYHTRPPRAELPSFLLVISTLAHRLWFHKVAEPEKRSLILLIGMCTHAHIHAHAHTHAHKGQRGDLHTRCLFDHPTSPPLLPDRLLTRTHTLGDKLDKSWCPL